VKLDAVFDPNYDKVCCPWQIWDTIKGREEGRGKKEHHSDS